MSCIRYCLAGRMLAFLSILPLLSFTAQAETYPGSDRASPELAGFIKNIHQSHPLLQEAESELAVARSRLEAAGQPRYNPEIELDASGSTDDWLRIGP